MILSVPVIVIIVILLLLHFRLRYCYAGRLLAQIPGPKTWPIFGNMFTIIKSPEALFLLPRSMFRDYGNICKLEAFGIRSVHIYSPDDVEILFSTTKFNEKKDPYTFLKVWLRDGLLISNGEKWQQRRKLLTPAFHFNILKKYTQTFIDHTEEFLEKVKGIESDLMDIFPLISNATLNIMCQTSMGISLDEQNITEANKYLKTVHTLGRTLAYRITRVWLHVEFVFNLTQVFATQRKAVGLLHEFTSKIIRERKKYFNDNNTIRLINENEVYRNKGCLALLDLLLQNEKEGKLDLEDIREEVDTFMFEGHDTTAMALSFLIMRLANEPEVQDRLSEEMIKIFGDSERQPTFDDINSMKYLDCCIKESLRLYPSVPFIARYTTTDVTLSGYKVPAGTQCHVHVYDLHHRKDYFPEPYKFIPERFLPENNIKRHPYSYIPFSAGPRNCIGQKFAMLEMKTVMSGLLRRYRLQPVTKPENIIFKADIILRSSNPLYVRLCSKQNKKIPL